MSPNNFAEGHLLKIDWIVADVTPVGSPARAERDILGMLLDVFWPIEAHFVGGGPLYDVGIHS